MDDPIGQIPADIEDEALQYGRPNLRRLIEKIMLRHALGMPEQTIWRGLTQAGCSEQFAHWLYARATLKPLNDDEYRHNLDEFVKEIELLRTPVPWHEYITKLFMTGVLLVLAALLFYYFITTPDGSPVLSISMVVIFLALFSWLFSQLREIRELNQDCRRRRSMRR